MQSEITANDLVVFKEGKNIMSGGYKINSLFLDNNISPMTSNNKSNQTGGNVSSIFSNLAVPAGLLLLQQKTTKKSIDSINMESKVISEDLHDKLLNHVKKDKKIKHNRKTRGAKKKVSKRTRRRNK